MKYARLSLDADAPVGHYAIFVGDPTDTGIPAYPHEQQEASTVWDITHNLGWDPAGIVVIAPNGDRYEPEIQYIDPGVTVRLLLSDSITGFAYLS